MTDRLKAVLALSAAIALEVTGSLSLKAALDSPAIYGIVVLAYVGAFVFLATTLRAGMPLGVAYGIWGAVGVVLTALLSHVLFDEPLTALMAFGIVIIVAGVMCVEIGSHAAEENGEGQ